MNTNGKKINDFEEFGLTLLIGTSIAGNSVEALRHAERIAKSGKFGRVMYLNTYQHKRKLRKTGHSALGISLEEAEQKGLVIESSKLGNLVNEPENVEKTFDADDPVRVVVINSWEFAAKDYRHRERLLFLIGQWIVEREISVIVYAQKMTSLAQAGTIQRGGFGKLAALADLVVLIDEEQKDEREFEPATFILNLSSEEPGRNYELQITDSEDEPDELFLAASADPIAVSGGVLPGINYDDDESPDDDEDFSGVEEEDEEVGVLDDLVEA